VTQNEFIAQMDRLHRTYGEKAYPKERMDAIWERVKDFPRNQMDRAVTFLIGENFSPPSLSKISEALGPNRSPISQPGKSSDVYGGFTCEPCRDFGFGFVGDTVVACACDKGQATSPAELVRQQKNYDKGREMFRTRASFKAFATKDLPYDPNERRGA
jgi:hypothetical protein